MNFNGKRVLVTGAGGFIGSHLAEALVQGGAEVRAFVHYNALGSHGWLDASRYQADIEIVAGNIEDRDFVTNAARDVDAIFHLAALITIPYSYIAPQSYIQTNINGTLNVLQAARQSSCARVVHTSTSEVFGSAQYVPMDEKHPLNAQSPYAASKTGADQLALSFHASYDLPVTVVRPFNTFGPRQSTRAVIQTIIHQALTADRFSLGNLTPTRDFTFVSDTVDGFIQVGGSENAIGHDINLGTGEEVSISDVVSHVADIVGISHDVVLDSDRVRPDASEVDRLCSNPSKALELSGWQSIVSVRQGLEETVAWVRDNLDRFKSGYRV